MHTGKIHLAERLHELAHDMREIASLMEHYRDDPLYAKHAKELTWAAHMAENWRAEIEGQA